MSERFFITVIPGLESVCHLELCEKWPQTPGFFCPPTQYFKGGIEVELPFAKGCELNQNLRTSTRILYRLCDFPCPDIETFKAEIKKVQWLDYFSKGESLSLSFSSRSSKLSKNKQIEKVFQNLGFSMAKSSKKIFVRFFRDHCEISIDTTGERAQFRGKGKKVGKAPLRDSTAAALVRILAQGLREPHVLVDPMMGSGTFLLEALSMSKALQRKFSFQDFPRYQKEKEEAGDSASNQKLFEKVYGFDRDEKMIEVVKHNISHLKEDQYQLRQQDLFSQDSFIEEERPVCVVLNPPWGRRLQKNKETVADWFAAIEKKFKPQRIGLLVPTPFTIPEMGWEKVRDVYFENSGVLNRFIVFMKKDA